MTKTDDKTAKTNEANIPEGAADAATIAVVGTGYVGLTTAVCLAHLGNRVIAADIDPRKVDMLGRGVPTILEEGLPELLAEGVQSGRLSFTTDTAEAAEGADFVFLCVPTPQGADGSADLSYVEDAARTIAPRLKPGAVVVTKSTVPVGSVGIVVSALNRPDTAVVSNPEFLREGKAVHDWLHPDRVVIGSDDRSASERLAKVYEPLDAPVVITDPASSETIKYACNAFLAAKVSFVNAIANLCGAVGADAVDVIRGMSYDRRIGADHLAPGPGWGGSCFPKDTSALIRIAEDHGYDFGLLKEAIAANNEQFERVAAQVEEAAGGDLQGVTIAAWGLTFKAATDDLRESPALSVLRRVAAKGASIRAFDPTLPDQDNPNLASLPVRVVDDPYSACEGARVLVVLTEWPEFRDFDLRKVAAAMTRPSIVDTRNIIEPNDARAAGCSYVGMGRS
jgi:UDPglucose 6-dehydrogenase